MTDLSKGRLIELAYDLSQGETPSSEMATLARQMGEDEQQQRELDGYLDTLRSIRLALIECEMRDNGAKGRCLDDETFAAYVDGALDNAARQAAEKHISWCGQCLAQLAELAALVSDIHPALEHQTGLHYVVEVTRRGLRLLLHPENEFSFIAPTPAAVLSSGDALCSEFQKCCTWRQSVGDTGLVISLMQTGDERVDVSLTITCDSSPVPKARITLRRDNHIVQSEAASNTGRVSLHNLEVGTYECEIKLPSRGPKECLTLDLCREHS